MRSRSSRLNHDGSVFCGFPEKDTNTLKPFGHALNAELTAVLISSFNFGLQRSMR
jgi:hypothetical protein